MWTWAQDFSHKDPLTIRADSLHDGGNYSQALVLRESVLGHVAGFSFDYRAYVRSKRYHTEACLLEERANRYYLPEDSLSLSTRKRLLHRAIGCIEKARELYAPATRKDKQYLYNLQNRIYHQKGYLGEWEGALQEAQAGLTILRDTLKGNTKKMVDLIYDIGYINGQLGHYNEAVKSYQKSLDLYEDILKGPHTDIAQAYLNIAKEYHKIGFLTKELHSLQRARDIWTSLKNPEDNRFLYRCYGALFQWYLEYGDLDIANHYLYQKSQLFDQEVNSRASFLRNPEENYHEKLTQNRDEILLNLAQGDTAMATGKLLRLVERIPENERMDFPFEAEFKGWGYGQLAKIQEGVAPDNVLANLDRTIAIAAGHPHQVDIYPLLTAKACFLVNSGKWREATTLLDRILVAAENEQRAERFSLQILYGRALWGLGDTVGAKHHFERALEHTLKAKGNSLDGLSLQDLKPMVSFSTVEGFMTIGDFYMDQYQLCSRPKDLNDAMNHYLLASRVFHTLYLGNRYNPELYRSYSQLTERLLKCSQLLPQDQREPNSTIITEIENNGSQYLWSKFMFNRHGKTMGIPPPLLERERDLRSQVAFYYQKIYSGETRNNASQRTLWQTKVDSLLWEDQHLFDGLKEDHGNSFSTHSKAFDIKALQQQLPARTLLLKYLFTKDSLYLVGLDKEHLTIRLLGEREPFERKINSYLDALRQRDPLPGGLREQLLPMALPIGTEHLVILPDGALSYLPFEALYQGKDFPSISYSTSLLVYGSQLETKGNPSSNRMGVFYTSTSNGALGDLPQAQREMETVLHYFPGKGSSPMGKDLFLKEAENYDLLHLATHSIIDPDPARSALYFSNGNLYAPEIYNQQFHAKLVVLSSCDTGVGHYQKGEGILSLARAFTYAGVPATVMGMWKVDDRTTAQLMGHFYRYLKMGLPKDEALRNAKLEYLGETEDPLLRHPYYWAGFVVNGNTDPIVSPHQTKWWWLLMLPGILGILWAWKQFRKIRQ